MRRLPLLLLLALPAWTSAQVWSGKVVQVSDGDTIKVLRAQGIMRTPVTIRFHGIDAPEKSQAYGEKSRLALAKLVAGKTVRIDTKDTDRYGRTVAVVWADGKDVNLRMVSDGWAWWYRQYARNEMGLERAEASARAARRGLWADSNPVAPWDFRQKARKASSSSNSGNPFASQRTPGAPLPGRRPTPPSPSGDARGVGILVYVTGPDSKYHRAGCRYLKKTKIPKPLAQAMRDHRPCSVCF